MALTVFISHSTKNAEADAFLTEVDQQLTAAGFQVKLDRNGLIVGQGWQDQLYQWMDEAHAAVLLLTDDAVKSEFVAVELSILSWRACRGGIGLVPVYFGNIKRELDKGVIGKLRLKALQGISIKIDPQHVQAQAASTAKQVVDALNTLTIPTLPRELLPTERRINNVVKLLEKGEATAETLVQVALRCGFDPQQLVAQTESAAMRAFASQLLDPNRSSQAYLAIRLLQHDYEFDEGAAEKLRDYIAPQSFAASAAHPLAARAFGPAENRAYAINANHTWTTNALIAQAFSRPLKHGQHLVELTPLDDPANEVESVCRQVQASFSKKFGVLPTPEMVQKLEEQFTVVYVVINLGVVMVSPAALKKVRERFSKMNIVLLTGGVADERQLQAYEQVLELEELKPGHEEEARLAYHAAGPSNN